MATTKIFLTSPGTAVESIIEGTTALAVQSSFLVSVQFNNAGTVVNEGNTTRGITKKEVVQALYEITEYIIRDPNGDFG